MADEDTSPDEQTAVAQPAGEPLRRLSDARTLRALAHPVRIALVEALAVFGPMTATEVGEEIGESPTTCSFHLRQLARYGFVEEAGGGKGRARPWRMSSVGMHIAAADGDLEAQIASTVLVSLVRERQMERLRTWLATRSSYPADWQEAAIDGQYLFHVTAAELEELGGEVHALLMSRFADRRADPSLRPEGALPIELLLHAYPVATPGSAAGKTSGSAAGQTSGRAAGKRP